MDSIGLLTPPIVIKLSAPSVVASAPQTVDSEQEPITTLPAVSTEKSSSDVANDIDLRAAEQKRLEAVQKASQEVANNTYVVSDKTFTIFKDVTGQYITRFTSLRDGRVTYIPEPELLKSINSSHDIPLLSISV